MAATNVTENPSSAFRESRPTLGPVEHNGEVNVHKVGATAMEKDVVQMAVSQAEQMSNLHKQSIEARGAASCDWRRPGGGARWPPMVVVRVQRC